MTRYSPELIRAAFAHVDQWVFDLDNTLYPHSIPLWQQLDDRIKGYIANFLSVEPEEAFRIQKDYYKRYGTSLRGLMMEHGMDPKEFLHYVHDIDHSPVPPNPALADAIAALPGKKYIFTSGTQSHAAAVTKRLGIEDHFHGVFDIVDAGHLPKPHQLTYETFLARHAVLPQRAAMFEDLARNLEVPHRLGMKSVLVVPPASDTIERESWETEGREDHHIDFITDDLASFLAALIS